MALKFIFLPTKNRKISINEHATIGFDHGLPCSVKTWPSHVRNEKKKRDRPHFLWTVSLRLCIPHNMEDQDSIMDCVPQALFSTQHGRPGFNHGLCPSGLVFHTTWKTRIQSWTVSLRLCFPHNMEDQDSIIDCVPQALFSTQHGRPGFNHGLCPSGFVFHTTWKTRIQSWTVSLRLCFPHNMEDQDSIIDCVPQALFSTQHGRPGFNHGLCPSGFVFHTTWKTRIQSWTVSLRLCFPHNMEDQDSIIDCVPQAWFSTQHGRPGFNHRLCPSGFVFHTTWKTRIQSWTVSLRLCFPHNMEDQDSIMDCVPQALFSTQHGRPGFNHRLCPSGLVFHTTWKTRIQSWTVSLRLCFPHNMEDQDSIIDCVPQALFSTQHGRPGFNHGLCPSGLVFHTTWKTRIQSWTVSLRLGFPHNMEDQDSIMDCVPQAWFSTQHGRPGFNHRLCPSGFVFHTTWKTRIQS